MLIKSFIRGVAQGFCRLADSKTYQAAYTLFVTTGIVLLIRSGDYDYINLGILAVCFVIGVTSFIRDKKI